MNLVVVGCGKMGLPLAVQAARRGMDVTGVDLSERTVEAINRGRSPIDEPGLAGPLGAAVKRGRLRATTDLAVAVKKADAVIVLVPVLLDGMRRADLDSIKKVAFGIADALRPGAIVSFETTVPVGTTRNVLAPLFERNGLRAEKDYYLVFSPERVKSGLVMQRLDKVPKVVGGIGPVSLKKGIRLYRAIVKAKVVGVGSLENAEMIKLAGMVYRDVNIALANEIARYCDAKKISLPGIIPLINTDGEAHLHEPGIGVGGHCAPVYPYFLIQDAIRAGVPATLTEASREINDYQARYAAGRLLASLGQDVRRPHIMLLGLGFRPGVKEDTCSPAYLLKKVLEWRGAEISLCDPLYTEGEIRSKGFSPGELGGKSRLDAVILVTAHTPFLKVDWGKLKKRGVKVFVDGRNCLDRRSVERRGIRYIGIGCP